MEHSPEQLLHRTVSPSAIMDGVFPTSAAPAGRTTTPPASEPEFRACSPEYQTSSKSTGWTLPSILKQGRGSLSTVSVEQLQECLQPVFAGFQQLDPEALLQLDRVHSGGARLRDGYVVPIVCFHEPLLIVTFLMFSRGFSSNQSGS